MIRLGLLLIGILICAAPSYAQNSDVPLEITADNSLEWHRNDNLFIARGNALAQQGDTAVSAETLTADYRDGAGGGMEIWRVTAVNDGRAEPLRMVSPDQTVTASEHFEYLVTEGKFTARGAVKIERPQDTLQADAVTALMKENAQGQQVLNVLEATRNVVITTPTEILSGDYGIYHADTQKAEIKGHVVIRRGPNVLKGDLAKVDLATNTSQLFGGGKPGGRVSGVFYPGSEKKKQ